jgi:hypothetical protein
MHFYGHIILAYRIRKSPLVAVTEYEMQGPGTMEPSEVHRVYHRSSYKKCTKGYRSRIASMKGKVYPHLSGRKLIL